MRTVICPAQIGEAWAKREGEELHFLNNSLLLHLKFGSVIHDLDVIGR